MVERLSEAIARPRWQLFLGRKSYLPVAPVLMGVRVDPLEDALRTEAWPSEHRTDRQRLGRLLANGEHDLLVVLEQQDGSGEDVRSDQPVGAAYETRAFALRALKTTFYAVGTDVPFRWEETDVSLEAGPESA